jgi:hypothetical protein
MQITEIDAKQELETLASLVYNDKILAAVANKIERDSFKSQFSFKIAERCLRHYEKYHKAPKFLINNYIENQIENSTNKEETKHLQKILDNLSGLKKTINGKQCNTQYWIDRIRTYLHHVKLGNVFRDAKASFDAGSFDKMEMQVSKLSRAAVNGNGHTTIDLYLDSSNVTSTFENGEKPLFTYGDTPAGLFFDKEFARENFVAFQGPEKSFKSFWMQEICHKALKSRLRVLFIGIGDMSQTQYNRRFYSRIAYRPWSKCEYMFPTGWNPKDGNNTLPKRQKRTAKAHITVKEIEKALRKFSENYLQTDKPGKFFKMLTVGSISIAEIETIIRQYEDVESWTPDVLIIDYADRLSPPKGLQDKIAITDHNWNRLRDIALENHNLVVTATQAKRSAYKGFLQTRDDVADSKTKTAVVTGLIGICANSEEYQNQTRRLNWIVCRGYTRRSMVTVAACPAISNPAVIST